jgi:hypothetical protein
MRAKQLNADDWRAVLRRVAEKLPRDREWRVTVIGGVAMALGFGSRRTTADADVVATPWEVIEAARSVAPEFGLDPDWMNANAEAAGYVVSSVAQNTRLVLREASLEVHIPSVEHMLAMKVARFAGSTDIDDAKLLLSKLGHLDDVEAVWTLIGGLVPVAEQAQARHNLENLWDLVHEPA